MLSSVTSGSGSRGSSSSAYHSESLTEHWLLRVTAGQITTSTAMARSFITFGQVIESVKIGVLLFLILKAKRTGVLRNTFKVLTCKYQAHTLDLILQAQHKTLHTF